MNEQDEKMVYASFAMQALLSGYKNASYKQIAKDAWAMAQAMIDEKPTISQDNQT